MTEVPVPANRIYYILIQLNQARSADRKIIMGNPERPTFCLLESEREAAASTNGEAAASPNGEAAAFSNGEAASNGDETPEAVDDGVTVGGGVELVEEAAEVTTVEATTRSRFL